METLTTKLDYRTAPRISTPEKSQKALYRDELETQIALCSNRKKLEKLKSQCQDLELLVGNTSNLSRNTMNPAGLNTLSRIMPQIVQNTPNEAKIIYFNPLLAEAVPPSNHMANSRKPLREISRFDPLNQDSLATEVNNQDTLKQRPKINQSVQTNLTEDKGVPAKTQPESKIIHKQSAFNQRMQTKQNRNTNTADDCEVTQIRDNVREAKLREKQLQFENYLKTDFPQEVR